MSDRAIGRVGSDGGVFGEVIIEHAESRIGTWLESDPARVFVIERRGPRTRKSVPIGTRDEKHLTAALSGQPVVLRPGSGRLVRRTYRVVVEFDSRILSFGPKDLTTCRFIDGRPREIEKEFGTLTLYRDGSVRVEWAYPMRIPLVRRTVIPPDPTVDDVLIACGVAAAFGTGSLSLTSLVMGLVSSVFPPI